MKLLFDGYVQRYHKEILEFALFLGKLNFTLLIPLKMKGFDYLFDIKQELSSDGRLRN